MTPRQKQAHNYVTTKRLFTLGTTNLTRYCTINKFEAGVIP